MLRYIYLIIGRIRSYICYIILKYILGWGLKKPQNVYDIYKKNSYVILYPYESIYEIIISILFVYSCNLSIIYINDTYNFNYMDGNHIYIYTGKCISQKQYDIIKKKNINIITFLIDFKNNIVSIKDITNKITIYLLKYIEIYNKIYKIDKNIVKFIDIDENTFINPKKSKIYYIMICIISMYIYNIKKFIYI